MEKEKQLEDEIGKKFIFKREDGIDYITQDIHNELIKLARKELIEDEIKFLEQPHIKGNNIDIKKRIKQLQELKNEVK